MEGGVASSGRVLAGGEDGARGGEGAAGADDGGVGDVEEEGGANGRGRECADRGEEAEGDGIGGIADERFGEAHAAELEAYGLFDAAIAEREAFEAAAAEVEDVEVAERNERRIGSEAVSDEVGFFGAGKDADFAAGGGMDELAKIGTVMGVAHRAGGDERGGGRRKGRDEGEEFADGGESAGHAFVGEARFAAADPGADTGIETFDGEGANGAVGRAVGDEGFDGVTADVDDGDGGGGHGTTKYTKPTKRRKF